MSYHFNRACTACNAMLCVPSHDIESLDSMYPTGHAQTKEAGVSTQVSVQPPFRSLHSSTSEQKQTVTSS